MKYKTLTLHGAEYYALLLGKRAARTYTIDNIYSETLKSALAIGFKLAVRIPKEYIGYGDKQLCRAAQFLAMKYVQGFATKCSENARLIMKRGV